MHFIDTYEILNGDYTVLAHTGQETRESLDRHIQRCQYYFLQMFEEKNINEIFQRFVKEMAFQNEDAARQILLDMSVNLVTFHDFGKLNPKFQRDKMGNEADVLIDVKGVFDTQHSFFSAIIYLDYFMAVLDQCKVSDLDRSKLKTLLLQYAYLISRHHSHLKSAVLSRKDADWLIKKLKANPMPGYRGLRYFHQHDINALLREDKFAFSSQQSLMIYFYTRLMYSLLVASDYYATSEYYLNQKMDIMRPLSVERFKEAYENSALMEKIKDYEKNNYSEDKDHLKNVDSINDLRSEIFIDANHELSKHMDDDIFFLEAPTGSGKSNTALGLTFKLLQNRQKIFYIYPFNTLVEQNRKSLQASFSDPLLLDEIVVVNSAVPIKLRKNMGTDLQDYKPMVHLDEMGHGGVDINSHFSYLDRQFLNYPFILSTHVSFFKLLFGHRQEDVFGFYQLAGSVIVLDEIQSYNNLIWAEMIDAFKACAKLLDMKFIIMSATLPNLSKLAEDKDGITDLMKFKDAYYQHPLFKERVKNDYDLLKKKVNLDVLLEHIIATQSPDKKILVEFISKRSAEAFYKKLKCSDKVNVPVACITGYDNLYQREKILRPIMENQISGMILVATQVIEAGVDIDMDIGYKDISVLDSEEQFLGRVNRSYSHKNKQGYAHFFNMDSVKKIYQNDFRTNKEFLLDKESNQLILENKDFSSYYHLIIQLIKENRNERTDEYGLESFYKDVLSLEYERIDQRMKLIEENYWSTDVFFSRQITLDDGNVLVGKDIWNEYKRLLTDYEMDYSERQIKLSEVRAKMTYFIYSVPKKVIFQFNDSIGDLAFIEDGEKYFTNDRLNLDVVEEDCLIL